MNETLEFLALLLVMLAIGLAIGGHHLYLEVFINSHPPSHVCYHFSSQESIASEIGTALSSNLTYSDTGSNGCVKVIVDATPLKTTVVVKDKLGKQEIKITEDRFVKAGDPDGYVNYVNGELTDLVEMAIEARWERDTIEVSAEIPCLGNEATIHNGECKS